MRLLKTKHHNVQDSNDVSTSFPGFSPTDPTSRFLLSPQLTIIPWLLRWLNTVWRAVSSNTRDGACFKLDKQTWRRKSNSTQKTISQNLIINILWYLAEFLLLRLYSIVYVAMETTKTSNFTCQSNFSLRAATFLLPWFGNWFGKWHILTNFQNCVQPP